MKERPILFSGAMVRAILDGNKTQTRRVVTPMPPANTDRFWWHGGIDNHWYGMDDKTGCTSTKYMNCPYGELGDRLWVREAWRIGGWRDDGMRVAIDYAASPELAETPWINLCGEAYSKLISNQVNRLMDHGVMPQDGNFNWRHGECPLPFRPSIHMPRWASRITLEVTGIRVQRLQDITEDDAAAEGVEHSGVKYDISPWKNYALKGWEPHAMNHSCALASFVSLWDSIYKRRGMGWEVNPWVWAVAFKRLPGPFPA